MDEVDEKGTPQEHAAHGEWHLLLVIFLGQTSICIPIVTHGSGDTYHGGHLFLDHILIKYPKPILGLRPGAHFGLPDLTLSAVSVDIQPLNGSNSTQFPHIKIHYN